MATPVQCPKGHWFKPGASGKMTLCPRCKAESPLRSNKRRISEDEVLAILAPPKRQDPPLLLAKELMSEEDWPSNPVRQCKKVCPTCPYETFLASEYCPRCGNRLKIALSDESCEGEEHSEGRD